MGQNLRFFGDDYHPKVLYFQGFRIGDSFAILIPFTTTLNPKATFCWRHLEAQNYSFALKKGIRKPICTGAVAFLEAGRSWAIPKVLGASAVRIHMSGCWRLTLSASLGSESFFSLRKEAETHQSVHKTVC